MRNLAGQKFTLGLRMPMESAPNSILIVLIVSVMTWSGWSLPASANDEVRAGMAAERIHRHRPSANALRNVLAKVGNDAEILRMAQVVLDLPTDSFSETVVSLRLSIERCLRDAPEETRRKYQSLVGAESNRLLAEGIADPSTGQFRNVCRRFYLTNAGYAAAEQLVALWLDSGEYGLARRLADQVLAEPLHQPRITPQFRRLALSLKQIDADESRSGGNSTGGDFEAVFLRRFLKNRESLVPLESGWMWLGGNASRSRIVRGSPPIPAASWTADFFPDQSSYLVQEFLKDWEGNRREVDQPCCAAAYPIVVDGNLVFRDSTGVRSISTAQGTTNWIFRCNFSPLETNTTRSEVLARRRILGGSWVPGSQNPLGENSLMGVISSDGKLIFAVDSTIAGDGDEPATEASLGRGRPFRNRLVALHAASDQPGGSVAWVHDGQVPAQFKKSTTSARLSFLGPPLPGATELLCLTEHDFEIHLTALEPRSGAILWTQPLCTVDRSDLIDPDHYEVACLPVRSNGVVVCPTNTGLLVAVDQVRLNLLWAVFVDDLPDVKRPPNRTGARTPPVGYSGYASHVMVSGGRVVYLPPHSLQLHCLDLATGKFLWSVPRADAEFVGAIANDRVLVVGRQFCRSLTLEDGQERWRVPSGMPAGRGIAIGNRYSLPLENGRLASLDLLTGRDQGTKALRSKIELGHLVADRDRVYSLSPRGLVAFPQVDHVLAKIDPPTPGRAIMLAEASVVQGDLVAAERQLRAVLAGDLSSADRLRAHRDLKEILFERIADVPNVSAEDFDLLDGLLETPAEQFRFLVAASSRKDGSLGTRKIEQLAERAYEMPASVAGPSSPSDVEWVISPTVWCRLQMKNRKPKGFGERLQELWHNRKPRLKDVEPADEISRYVRIFDGEPDVELERSYLASRFAALGSIHAAEALWLRNKTAAKPSVAAEAVLRLMETWEKSGLVTDAVRQLDLLVTDYAEVRLPDGKTGSQFVRRLDRERPAKRVWLQSREPDWSVDHVEIHQAAAHPEFVQQGLLPGTTGNTFIPDRANIATLGPLGRPFTLGQSVDFVMSQAGFEEPQTLSIFDQRTKLRMGTLSIPFSNRPPVTDKLISGGHLIPFGVPGGILGISTAQLGDSEPVWSQLPTDLEGRRTPVFPGPSGAEFSSFTWRNRLYVVDSLDGTLLWQRLSPEPSHNLRLEVIGDRHALAVLSEDRSTYEVYETSTGRKLSTVQPGFTLNQWQGSYGHHVMGFVETPEGRRLQIRDLLKPAPEISELVSETSRQPMLLPGGELLYLGPGGEIKIFDVARCRRKFAVQLGVAEVSSPIALVRVHSDRTRYFVNLQRHTPTAKVASNNQAILNSPVAGMPVRDDIYAFDRESGELLWKRSIPYRTILQFPECRLPFLVTVSQVIDRGNNALQTLTIEVIDSSTGATIGFRDNLRVDQLLTAEYDGEAGRILIRGQVSDIELRFGPAEGQIRAGR